MKHADRLEKDEVNQGGRDELEKITREIVSPEKALEDLIPQAQALRDWFERQVHFRIDPAEDLGQGATRLSDGLAISPALAAFCVRELYRTTAFIRGLAEAITDSQRPGRPVRVLYAGCGPYAALAVPLMSLWSKEQVVFSLMDIHPDCLDSARALIEALGLADRVDEYLCADAIRYRIPEDRQPDVIVSETMAVCLRNEPQVSIARNLLTQAPAARMVPQSVSVELCMLNWSKEQVLMPANHVGEFPKPQRDRIYLGKVFELDTANILDWRGLDGDHLPAGQVRIPSPLEARYRPHLLTRIEVYGKHRLADYDCSLTMPRPLHGRPNFAGGETLQFRYALGARPELHYEVRD